LICSWEPTIEIKIADFGVSKLASSENNTQFRTNVGTEWYKAPEIFLSTQPYTTNVDLWSLGCVLYWMGEARTPFTDYNELFQYYHKGAMPSWSFRGTRTPLAVVMEGLLRAKPENRITTEEALSALLSEAEYTL
jgi:serine/threonine protein kinase